MTATDIATPVLGGVRVLVAEGDQDDSAATAAVLRLNGFDAREARSAREVLLLVSESRPSVLVTDLDLPDDDGYTLLRRVSQLPSPPKVIVVTAHCGEGVRLAVTNAGASAVQVKPADPEKLARLVGQFSGVLCPARPEGGVLLRTPTAGWRSGRRFPVGLFGGGPLGSLPLPAPRPGHHMLPDETKTPPPPGLLRCTSCGRLLACRADEVGGFIHSGWPICCGEVMTYADSPDDPGALPPPSPPSGVECAK
jgi:CheY-like chemotaxis protein